MTKTVLEKRYNPNKDVSFKGFVSENKHRSKVEIEELAALEDEIVKLEQEAYPDEVQPQEPKEQVLIPDSEEGNWKKRYSDLRRHLSKKEDEFKTKLGSKDSEIEELKKVPVKYPTTDEELQEWITKYPDVANIIKTIALKENQELAKEISNLRAEKAKEDLQFERKRAYNQLLELQPDFDEIRKLAKFAEYDDSGALVGGWLNDQPKAIQDSLFRPSFDEKGVKAAARVIDLFKNETGVKKPVKQEDDKLRAASNVKGSVSEQPKTNDGSPRFTESQVARMSGKEYERLEEQIEDAMRKGPPYFVMDISGAAR